MPTKMDTVRASALALPDTTEQPHHHHGSFRVRGKIFATVPPGNTHLHLFLDADAREQALAMDPGFLEPLRWGGKVVGVRATLAHARAGTIKALLRQAHAQRQAKTRRPVPEQRYLAGGNPQIAKADGDAPIQAYIAALGGWKRSTAQRLDALVASRVPEARRAVRWNSPFYGIEGRGWFLSVHVFTRCVKVTFFAGASLDPVPPGGSRPDARWLDLHEGEFDERLLAGWIDQARRLPGWGNC